MIRAGFLDSLTDSEKEFWNTLTERRQERLLSVLKHRTYHISLVLDEVDDGRNQSAILRSCDAFGIQKVSVIRGRGGYAPRRSISRGVDSWLEVRNYRERKAAYQDLKNEGYSIYLSGMNPESTPLDELDVTSPVAIVFGNEHDGVSKESFPYADGFFHIPMSGFVESLNVSVAAAFSAGILVKRARELSGSIQISEAEQLKLLRQWIQK